MPLQGKVAGCIALAMVALTASGCNDPAYHATRAIRLERLQKLDRRIVKSEQRRPGNLKQLGRTIERHNDLYHRRLVRTWDFVCTRHAANTQRWFDRAPQRLGQFARLWNGRTERYPAAYGIFIY